MNTTTHIRAGQGSACDPNGAGSSMDPNGGGGG
jgi:hypothetical protein